MYMPDNIALVSCRRGQTALYDGTMLAVVGTSIANTQFLHTASRAQLEATAHTASTDRQPYLPEMLHQWQHSHRVSGLDPMNSLTGLACVCMGEGVCVR